MKVNDIRQLDNGRLNERLGEIDRELFSLRFQKQTGRLTNTARYGQLRKEYAQIKMVLHERVLAAQAEGR
jgi:large subunit ribosomal protein L29